MTFSYERTVYLGDTDTAGVVYFARLLSICHEAYESSLVVAGIELKTFYQHPTIAIPIVHAEIDYRRPIYGGDRLLIQVTPQQLSDSEFEISYEIGSADTILGRANTRHVCINKETRMRMPLPALVLQWIAG